MLCEYTNDNAVINEKIYIQENTSLYIENIVYKVFKLINKRVNTEKLKKIEYVLTNALYLNNSIIIQMKKLRDYHMETYEHSINTAILGVLMGTEINLSNKCLQNIALAGILHDLGKYNVPLEILDKPTKLTKAEFEIIKLHPLDSYAISSSLDGITQEVSNAILYHHYRINGEGYPEKNLRNLPIITRIISIADVYDALLTHRPYHSVYTIKEVYNILEKA